MSEALQSSHRIVDILRLTGLSFEWQFDVWANMGVGNGEDLFTSPRREVPGAVFGLGLADGG